METTSTHYIVDGRQYDRVSTTTAPFYRLSYTPKDWEFYLNRGTAVHQACSLWLTGQLTDESKLHPEILPYFLAFKQFWTTMKPELIESEAYVQSDKYRYAGRIDIKAFYRQAYCVIDLKTGAGTKPKQATAIQTAGYANAWAEQEGLDGILRMGVLLRGDARYRVEFYAKYQEDFNAFLTLLSAERLKERYAG